MLDTIAEVRRAYTSVSPSQDDLAEVAGRLRAKVRELAARYPTGAGSAGRSSAPAGRLAGAGGEAPAGGAARAGEPDEPGRPARAGDLAAVRTAQELSALAAEALRLAVDLARADGCTWQELGDVLGVTRQAAFQRFGQPVDPRTGKPTSEAMMPGAAGHATQLMIDWIGGRYGAVTADFNQMMAEKMSASGLADAWAQLAGLVGRYQRMGEPAARQAGDLTIVDIPMSFEASDMKGRVVYDKDGKVAGLFVLNPDAI
jgi:Protein of unknown function (DUF3887)